MTTKEYEELIINGIRGLPPETLAQIADYVYFIRQRVTHPKQFEAALHQALLNSELQTLAEDEFLHLEEEFADYQQKYPIE